MKGVAHNVTSMNPRGKHLANGTHGGSGGGGGPGARDRGQNINHLLSFTLPPRARPPPPTSARRSKRSGGTPFNKERYVSAQYRFLVKPTGDYTAYFADADIYLNWSDILSVLIPTSSALSGAAIPSLASSSQPSLETHEGAACPICLSPPTAPRMTKCGHVYCYPCILQYLSTTDGPASAGPAPIPGAAVGASVNSGNALAGPSSRQWKRCPICWDAVYARDLKAVRWWDPKAVASQQVIPSSDTNDNGSDVFGQLDDGDGPSTSPSVAAAHPDYLRMRLIERPQITTLALPQSSTWPTSSTSPSDTPLLAQHQAPWHFQPDVMTFCKFMLATPDFLLESLTQDIDELAAEKKLLSSFANTHGDDTIAYVTLAEKKVSEQMRKVVNELDTPAVRSAIGQAKNSLKEHEEALKSQRERDSEITSRIKRRHLDREKEQQKQRESGEATSESPEAPLGDTEAVRKDEPTSLATESSEHTEAFLAVRAQGQGGSYLSQRREEASAHNSLSTSTDEANTRTPSPLPAQKSHHRIRRNLNPPAPSSSYLFYQAASGQNIYLHPLDIKILHSQFGTYSRFPRNIAVKVQGAEEGSMNEELQKRCKYLTHLPKGTDVVFIEVDWESMAASPNTDSRAETSSLTDSSRQQQSHLIDEKTLKPYAQVLRARRNKRRDRERKEDRAKLKAEEAEAHLRLGGAAAAAAARQASHGRHHDRSVLSGSYGSEGGRSNLSALSSSHGGTGGISGTSPTFLESAMWGAERHFPIHPGRGGELGAGGEGEDFPPPISSSASSPPLAPSPFLGPPTSTGVSQANKTVWGTTAAKPSFSSTLHASSSRPAGSRGSSDRSHHHATWDEDVDEAWLELEEGFVLGVNNSRQVKYGKGFNSQYLQQQHHHQQHSSQSQNQSQSQSNRRIPDNGSNSGNSSTSNNAAGVSGTTTTTTTTSTSVKEEDSQATKTSISGGAGGAGGGNRKQRKAKLVLTGGGRGTA